MNHSWQSMDSITRYTSKWFALTACVAILALNVLPWNELRLESTLYFWEDVLWFGLSFTSSIAFYFSSFPEKSPLWPKVLSGIIVLTLLVLVSLHPNEVALSTEMNLWRGRCGFLITIIAFAQAGALILWAKKSAPRSPLAAGAWASLSASSLGCLFMQVICLHDNSLHLIIWHFVPLTIICFLGALIAQKKLHW